MAVLSPKLFLFLTLCIVLLTASINLNIARSQGTDQLEEIPNITNHDNLKIETASKGEIFFPTSMAFLGPNDILVLEKNTGQVKRILNGTVIPEPLLDVNAANKNERGLLGIAVSPKISINNINNITKKDIDSKSSNTTYVFLYYTESKEKDGTDVTNGTEPYGNRIYRYDLVNDKLVNPKLILELPISPIAIHNGGKIKIGPDNNLYLVIGDIDSGSKTENLKEGKDPDGSSGILRVTLDGKAVNPIFGEGRYLEKYFAYGIRNSFGIDFDPVTGNLWDTENGPQFGDEINLVEPGFNSGWRKVQGVWHYSDGAIGRKFYAMNALTNFSGKGKYSSPEFSWNNTIGVTDLTFLNSKKIGYNFENDIFVGDFGNGYLYNFDLNKNRTGFLLNGALKDKIANSYDELGGVIFAKGFGGITDLEVGPDGYLYILATYKGGSNCNPKFPDEFCVPYNSTNLGGIFRVVANDRDKTGPKM